MDFSIFDSFYKNFYKFITSIFNFFDQEDKDVSLEYKDENGNLISKTFPSIGKLKKEIKTEVENELTIWKQFSKLNNQFFDGEITFFKKRRNKFLVQVKGLAKVKTLVDINIEETLKFNDNQKNYLYYDVRNKEIFLSPKPFKISFNNNYLYVSRNSYFNNFINISTNAKNLDEIKAFFNSYLENKKLTLEFINTYNINDDFIEIEFEFDKNININKLLLETDFKGKIQLLGSYDRLWYNIVHTYKIDLTYNDPVNDKAVMKNIINEFNNTEYYKYYKLRFYFDKEINQQQFTILNLNLLTTDIYWLDVSDNTIKTIFDNNLIQAPVIFLGEFYKEDGELFFKPYETRNLFKTEFEEFLFNICIDNPFKDDTIDINIYLSENKLGSVVENGTKYFKILYNSEKILILLHPDVYLSLDNKFYYSLEIKRRDYEYSGA